MQQLKSVFAPTAVHGWSSWHLLIALPEIWFAFLCYTATWPLTLSICHGLPTALPLLIAKSSAQRYICMIRSWSLRSCVNFTLFMLMFSVLHKRWGSNLCSCLLLFSICLSVGLLFHFQLLICVLKTQCLVAVYSFFQLFKIQVLLYSDPGMFVC